MTESEFKKAKRADFLKEHEEIVRKSFGENATPTTYQLIGRMAKNKDLFPLSTTELSAGVQLKRLAENYIGWRFT